MDDYWTLVESVMGFSIFAYEGDDDDIPNYIVVDSIGQAVARVESLPHAKITIAELLNMEHYASGIINHHIARLAEEGE